MPDTGLGGFVSEIFGPRQTAGAVVNVYAGGEASRLEAGHLDLIFILNLSNSCCILPGMESPHVHAAVDDEARLRRAGLRITAPRMAVLSVVGGLDHPSVEEVHGAVRERLGAVSVQAVYDVLGAFEEVGLVGRIEPAGSPARYEGRVGDNHHHLVCRGCGEITDVDCAVGHAPCLEPMDEAGYVIDEAEVIYWGMCPRCQKADGVPEETGGKA